MFLENYKQLFKNVYVYFNNIIIKHLCFWNYMLDLTLTFIKPIQNKTFNYSNESTLDYKYANSQA